VKIRKRIARDRTFVRRITRFAMSPLVGLIASCTTTQQPSFSNFDQFETSIAQKLTAGPGAVPSDSFAISPTPGGAYPVGTLLPYGRTVEIYDECTIDQPTFYDAVNLNTTYKLTRGVALDAGLSQAIGVISSMGVNITDNAIVSLSMQSAKIQQLSVAQLNTLLTKSDCRAKIAGKSLVIVRGYVQAVRTFSTANVNTGDIKAGVKQIANLEAKYDAGSATLTVADTQPENFLQITSVVVVPPTEASPPAVGASGVTVPLPGTPQAPAAPPPANVAPVLLKPSAAPVNPSQRGMVFIQIDQRDSPDNGNKVRQLLSGKFSVAQDVDRIPSAKMPRLPQVRYFNEADNASADAVVAILKPAYPEIYSKFVSLPAPSGQLEVWLHQVQG
jgi:hypothetical protein